MSRFKVRLIRHGRVKIHGKWFYPDETHRPYKGELDGLSMAFGLYRPTAWHNKPEFISLWGTERAYRADDPDVDWPGPHCIDGKFYWDFWHEALPSEKGSEL